MKHPFKKLRTNRLSVKIILMVEVVLILSNSIFCIVSIINSRIGIRKSIQQRMLDIANCASGSINGDVLASLTAEDEGTPKYQAVYDTLVIFRDNVELEYVYAIRDEGDGRFTFTVDTDPNAPAAFGSEVKYTEALASAARGTAAVDMVPYTDAWGQFYSAYSPVYDSSGKVAGIIAADFSVTWFESQLSQQTLSTIVGYCVILLVTIGAAALLSLIAVTPFVRRQEQLSNEVKKKADENEQLFLQIVHSLADAVDAKDPYTNGHSRRVSQYAVKLAEALGWDKERVNTLRYAALLHDIGKIGVPDSILNSPKRLTEVEYAIIKSHAAMGGDILKNGIVTATAENVARSHHEKYDGSGYPLGLKGEDIPEEGRIVAIADAFDAMSSNRIYRKACDPDHIRRELEEGKGKQFDPKLVDIFIGLWDEGKLDSIMENEPGEEEAHADGPSALLREVVDAFVSQNAAGDNDIATGLMSRTAGETAIVQAMLEGSGCFALFSVDNLGEVNEVSGQESVEKVFRLLGEVLSENSENCLCCRLGGSEFLFFMKGVSEEEAAARVKKIIETFDEKKKNDATIVSVSLYAGLAMSTPDEPYSIIYYEADKALYDEKQNGQTGYTFYNKELGSAEGETPDVNRIVDDIQRHKAYNGALEVEYRQFVRLYEYISNLDQRFSHPFKLILISLDPTDGEVSQVVELEREMGFMERSIRQSIRSVDILTRYGKQQFLIILLGTDLAGAKITVARIFRDYFKMNGSSLYMPSYFIAEMD